MQTGQFTSAPSAVRMIASKEGFRGLYAVSNTFIAFSLSLHSFVEFSCGDLFHLLLGIPVLPFARFAI